MTRGPTHTPRPTYGPLYHQSVGLGKPSTRDEKMIRTSCRKVPFVAEFSPGEAVSQKWHAAEWINGHDTRSRVRVGAVLVRENQGGTPTPRRRPLSRTPAPPSPCIDSRRANTTICALTAPPHGCVARIRWVAPSLPWRGDFEA